MKQSEFVRWLRAEGATFEQGKRHLKVRLNGRYTVLPRHPSAELRTSTLQAIVKQLGIKGRLP